MIKHNMLLAIVAGSADAVHIISDAYLGTLGYQLHRLGLSAPPSRRKNQSHDVIAKSKSNIGASWSLSVHVQL
jgi:hypothetical protein